MADHAVNEWTRDDLPRTTDVHGPVRTSDAVEAAAFYAVDDTLGRVVDHLNAHHPKPDGDLQAVVNEGIRMKRRYNEQRKAREAAERERDGWQARAEAAERELADEYSEANQKAAAWDRVAAHPALRMDLLPDADHTYAGRVFERITWLAETAEAVTEMKPASAEARTAPAVTKDEIRYAIRGSKDEGDGAVGVYLVHEGEATDAVWSLVSGADPAVFVVRESQLPDVERNEDGDWLCEKALVVNGKDTAEDLRGCALPQLRHVAMREAVARAIEAEQATDPVEQKAVELFEATDDSIWAWATAPPQAQDMYLRIAAHVLGQEADQ